MDLSTRTGRRTLGERVKRAAKEKAVSVDELAEIIGCSRGLVYQYISGGALVQIDRLQLIAEAVGKSITWFFEDTSPQTEPPELPAGPPSVASHDTREATSPESKDRLEFSIRDDDARRRERLEHLRTLAAAQGSPPDWRAFVDTHQMILALLEPYGGPTDVADVLLKQGNALLRLNDYGAAKAKLQEAANLFRTHALTARHLDCLQSIGNADARLGRSMQALEAFRQVSEGSEWRHRWRGTLAIGAVHEMQGNYSEAAEAFIRTQDIIGEVDILGKTDVACLYLDANWVNLALAWGEYDRVVETARRCVMTAQRLGDQDQYIEGLLNCALGWLGLEDFRSAIEEAERAINVAQLTRDHERWSLALSVHSLCLTACRQTSRGIIDAKEALTMALRHGAHRPEVVAQRAIATAYLSAENLVEAKYHIDQAMIGTESERLTLPRLQFIVLSAQASLRAGDRDAAVKQAHSALATAESLSAKQVQHDCHVVLASSYNQDGEWSTATVHASRAAEIANQLHLGASLWRSQFPLAVALANLGEDAEAEIAFGRALAALKENRRLCMEAVGTDTLPDDPDAVELCKTWVLFLERLGRTTEAQGIVEDLDWPIFESWIQEHNNDA